jgi:hypothetical protein
MLDRYKRFKWARRVLMFLAIAACTVPVIVTAIRIGVRFETKESKWALTGAAAFVCILIIIIVLKSFIAKFISMLPFTLMVLISIGGILLVVIGLKSIIDDVIRMLKVGCVGAFVGFCLEAASMMCLAEAKEAHEIYLRREASNG